MIFFFSRSYDGGGVGDGGRDSSGRRRRRRRRKPISRLNFEISKTKIYSLMVREIADIRKRILFLKGRRE